MQFPHIDPVIVHIGPFALRWYGVMYLIGFLIGFLIIRRLCASRQLPLNQEGQSDLLFYCVLGVILGGRLGYVVFYNAAYYLQHPLQIFSVWEGGMSFHGGLLGVVVAAVLFSWRRKLSPLLLGDILVTASAPGLGLGRIGNFINGELWGRPTTVPWAMVFPAAGPEPRHPSQLYEATLEGLVLFAILWWLHRRKVPHGVPFFTFFLLYGSFRFLVEFFRQPDAHLGFLWAGATMGQLLCLPMIGIGLLGILVCRRKGGA